MQQGNVSMTSLAKTTGLPYRTVQNYLSGTTRMPAAAYIQICDALGINNQFVTQGTFHLQFAHLYDALWKVLGDGLLDLKSLPNSTGSHDVKKHNLKQAAAHLFAINISEAYNEELQHKLSEGYVKRSFPPAQDRKGSK